MTKRNRMRLYLALPLGLVLLSGCPSQQQPKGPVADESCPTGLPAGCKVLKDETDPIKNTVDYHVLVPQDTKHDQAQKHLEALYRHLMTRRDTEPASLYTYLYTSEVQYTTPPMSPVASVIKKAGELAPTFDNKLPLELWQQVEQALNLEKRFDRKLKRKLTYEADPAGGRVTVTIPYTESGKEDWAAQLSFVQIMNMFTDTANALFGNVPDLRELVFVVVWKDEEAARIDLSRGDYQATEMRDVEEKIGALHGRSFLELATSRGTEAQVASAQRKRVVDVYRKILDKLKGRAFISPKAR